jgi:hypothetical protein
MMRLTEQLEGTAQIFERDTARGDVRTTSVCISNIQTAMAFRARRSNVLRAQSAPPGSSFDPIDVWRRGADLTLCLEDGRMLEFQLSSSAGAMIATSRISS